MLKPKHLTAYMAGAGAQWPIRALLAVVLSVKSLVTINRRGLLAGWKGQILERAY